jgi:hypothetical protein
VHSNLVIVARLQTTGGTLSWIGLYRYGPESRGAGTIGAGIWLENGVASSAIVLGFLHDLVDVWTRLPTADKTSQLDWLLFDEAMCYSVNSMDRPLCGPARLLRLGRERNLASSI